MPVLEMPIATTWKQPLTINPDKPHVALCSLWDLLYYIDDRDSTGAIRTRFNTNNLTYRMQGYELPHTTIVLNTELYSSSDFSQGYRRFNIDLDDFAKYQLYAIELAIPRFDTRTTPLYITQANMAKYLSAAQQTSFLSILNTLQPQEVAASDYFKGETGPGIKIFEKKAAMRPPNCTAFQNLSPINPNIEFESPLGMSYILGSIPSDAAVWRVACEEDPTTIDPSTGEPIGTDYNAANINQTDILLTNHDLVFEQKYLSAASTFTAYGGICLNPISNNVKKLIRTYYNSGPAGSSLSLPTGNMASDGIDSFTQLLLKNTWVWVKCAFFGDYIDYRDFNQKLNQDSEVVFRNAVIAGNKSDNRYNKSYTNPNTESSKQYTTGFDPKKDKAVNTVPYISQTAPSIDLMASQLLFDFDPNYNSRTGSNSTSFDNNLNKLLNAARLPANNIGSIYNVPMEQQNRDYDLSTLIEQPQQLTPPASNKLPPIYFDPVSRKSADKYDDVPIVTAKDGNLVVNGRIFSTTIDEIWVAIKKLAAGRPTDVTTHLLILAGFHHQNENHLY